MDWLQAIGLALIQGLTEFLPISSSGHLVLAPLLFGSADQGLAFDVAVHVGSLLAIMWFFRRDVFDIAQGSFQSLSSRQWNEHSHMFVCMVIATIPVGLVALLFNDLIESQLRSPLVIACTTLLFGLLLGFADKSGKQEKDIGHIVFSAALIIGLAQAIALIPGTSRSGITITAALLLGFRRDAAARFSFLLSMPAIALSGAYKGLELMAQEAPDWGPIFIGLSVSAVSAYACIYWFMSVIERMGMMPFVIYRVLLGLFLFLLFL